ncbi:choice-of-anchor D domain-containing protein [Leptolyngbya sp. AN02str]|uniref:choice-of-anchor D domain-containing protein n=1 Tax=Leptolyngbya sp. AN02str TaxID=3423363 RepID=UPI003D31E19A
MVQSSNSSANEETTLQRARQGDPAAIATLINRALNPKGMSAQVWAADDGLHLVVDAPNAPPQREMVTFLQQGVTQLGTNAFQTVNVYGRQMGQPQPTWQQAIAVSPQTAHSSGAANTAPPLTHIELGNGSTTGQSIAIADKLVQLSAHGAVVTHTAQHKPPLLRSRPAPTAEQTCRPFSSLINRRTEQEMAISALQGAQPVEFHSDTGMGKTALLQNLLYNPQVEAIAPDGLAYHAVYESPIEDVLFSLFNLFFEYESTVPHKPTHDQVLQAFRGKRSLLVLDDVRLHPPHIEQMVNSLPSQNLIVASSERQLWGESHSAPLEGLALPDAAALVEQRLDWALSDEERSQTEQLCTLMLGHPLRLTQMVALVQQQQISLGTLVQQLQSNAVPEVLTLRACSKLPEAERRALAAFGVLGDVPVRSQHLAGLIGSSNTQPVLDTLLNRGLITCNGDSRFTIAGNLVRPLQQFWNLSQWVQPVILHFTNWAKQQAQMTGNVAADSDLMLRIMDVAAQHNRWSDVLNLASVLDPSLTLSGFWGAWEHIWQRSLHAAQALNDQAAIAYCLHQLGTRALCLDDTFTANSYLSQALQLRQATGNSDGAAITQHNLNLLIDPAYPAQPTPSRPPAQPVRPAPPANEPPLEPPPGIEPDMASPPSRVPAAAQVALISALFLGLGGLLAYQLTRNPVNFALTPEQVNFGTQELNRATQPQTITVQNNDDEPLRLTQVAIAGTHPTDFQIASETCTPALVQPAQACAVQVTFNPQAAGDRTAELIVGTANGTAQRRVVLAGNSPTTQNPTNPDDPEPPVVLLNFQPGNLDFGDQPANTESASRRIVLRNASPQALTIRDIVPSGNMADDFRSANDCTGGPLAPDQSCSIYVTFLPRGAGSRTANLSVIDTANNLWDLPLRGNGIIITPQEPALSLRPGSIDFGSQQINTTSQPQTILVSNSGNQPLQIDRLDFEGSGEFSIRRNACSREGSLAPGRSCAIDVVFTPRSEGGKNANLIFRSNDPKGPSSLYLNGYGALPQVPRITADPTGLNFSTVELEAASRAQPLTITNTGNSRLSIGTITADTNEDFVSDRAGAIGASCSRITLEPGQSCRFGVVFIPQVEGDRYGRIFIPSNAADGQLAILMYGVGARRQFPSISISPSSLLFGEIPQGSISAPQRVTITNSGGAPLTLQTLSIQGAHPFDFTGTNNDSFTGLACSNLSLQPGQSCSLDVYFGPTQLGDRTAQLIVPSNDPNGTFGINLVGQGIAEIVPLPEPVPDRPQPRTN